jgi:DNA mismatch endonuclease Vsr
MAGIRGRDTAPELAVRRWLHRHGFRYRLHVKGLPGRPDVVFPSRRVAVFVHGCFWHQHPGCRYAYHPGSNVAFWAAKLDSNVRRDARQVAALEEAGWCVLVVWECEITEPNLAKLAEAIGRCRCNPLDSSGSTRTWP